MKSNGPHFSPISLVGVTAMTLDRAPRPTFLAMTVTTLACVLAAACTDATSLTVEVDVPTDANVQIEVTGPQNFSETIRQTTTFDHVAPGKYQVKMKETRKRIVRPHIDIIVAGTVEGAPVQITNESATVKVRYDLEPGSGRVWVPVAGEDKVVSFTGDELHKDAAASFTLPMPRGSGPDAVAMRRGDLWVALANTGEVMGFAAMTLAMPGGAPTPTKTVRGLGRPAGIAFDSSGDLFVADAKEKTVVRFSNLDESPARRATFRVEGTPRAVAFNAAGAMFVATADPAAVVAFSAAALGGSNATPKGAIMGTKTQLVSPNGLAFDADGSLWVSNDASVAVRFPADMVADVNGQVEATPTSGLVPPSDAAFKGFAFDNDGFGWFATHTRALAVLQSGVDMLTNAPALGAPLDLRAASADTLGFGALAFNPPPTGVPIRR